MSPEHGEVFSIKLSVFFVAAVVKWKVVEEDVRESVLAPAELLSAFAVDGVGVRVGNMVSLVHELCLLVFFFFHNYRHPIIILTY